MFKEDNFGGVEVWNVTEILQKINEIHKPFEICRHSDKRCNYAQQ